MNLRGLKPFSCFSQYFFICWHCTPQGCFFLIHLISISFKVHFTGLYILNKFPLEGPCTLYKCEPGALQSLNHFCREKYFKYSYDRDPGALQSLNRDLRNRSQSKCPKINDQPGFEPDLPVKHVRIIHIFLNHIIMV